MTEGAGPSRDPLADRCAAAEAALAREREAREAVERSLRDALRWQESLLEAARVGLWCWDVATGEAYYSREWKRQIGAEDHEVGGTLDEWSRRVHPEDLPRLEAALAERLASGVERSESEFRFRHADGSYRTIFAQGRILRDAEGRAVRVLGSHIDVTQVRAREADAARRETRRRALERMLFELSARFVDASAETIDATIDAALAAMGQLHAVDRAYVFQYDEGGDTMSNTHEWCADGIQPVRDTLQWLRTADYPWWDARMRNAEIVATHVAALPPEAAAERALFERQSIASLLVIPLRFRDRITGFIGFDAVRAPLAFGPDDVALLRVAGDILASATQRIRAEQERARLRDELARAQRLEAVGRLAGGVAHDFNNMLGVILGNVQLALDAVDPDAPLHADLREIETAARRSAELTRALLAFGRRQPTAPRVLRLEDAVEGTLGMLRRVIREDVALRWTPPPGLWPVRCDPAQLDQVIVNLGVNARDAIDGPGTIALEAANERLDAAAVAGQSRCAPGDYVRLTVRDDGCGMDEATVARIFEPFFTTKATGTGLGLASVHGLVEQNGGLVAVESRPGAGSAFHVFLPRAHEAAPTVRRDSVRVPPSSGETVLLVEDEPALLRFAARSLDRLGYRVLGAASPAEALAKAAAHGGAIDLLVTDVVMPEMDGRRLARRLREARPDLRVLFVSGHPADVFERDGGASTARLLPKPFSVGALARALRDVLAEPPATL